MKRLLYAILALLCMAPTVNSYGREKQPRLVVNIVVSSMRADDLVRYGDNFTEGGFKRIIKNGIYCRDAHYDYAATTTPAGLATLSTGAQPSVHGVIGESWWNMVDASRVEFIADSKAHPVPFSTGTGNYSPHRLTAPTFGDMLLAQKPNSKQVTIAIDPLSAIVMNGKSGTAYWVEKNKTYWTTSSVYTTKLAEWVAKYNAENSNNYYTLNRWSPLYDAKRYHNNEVAVVEDIKGKSTYIISDAPRNLATTLYGKMCYTPAGNTMLMEFASQAVAQEHLGKDADTDVLNICLDTSRYIAENYGPESIEYEDMLYRLDAALAEFLTFLYAQVDDPESIVVVLTSDHGTAPSYNIHGTKPRERFNHRQMEVIVNAYLGGRYGSGEYVVGYANKALYLNHEELLKRDLEIVAVEEEVAIFLLQLRGVSTAIAASSLRNSSFSDGRSRLMQQSFYAPRSGDVLIDFMPGWFVESFDYRSTSHGGYRYDSNVPLVIAGGGIGAQVVERRVSMVEVAPTLAEIVGINYPWASSATPMTEIR